MLNPKNKMNELENNTKEQTNEMEVKFKRIFMHEVGHFIAHQMNKLFYNGSLGVDEINIYKELDEYWGSTIPLKPVNDFKELPPPPERLVSFLILCYYGCVVQSAYQEIELNDCFNIYGKGDKDEIIGFLDQNKIYRNNEIFKLFCNYTENSNAKNHFSEVFKLNHLDYFKKKDNSHFKIDLAKLENKLLPFFDKHFEEYDSLVKDCNKLCGINN
jgi:hypothetical protein